MDSRRCLALLVLIVAPICFASGSSSPVYTWSNSDVLGDGSPVQVQYQTLPTSTIILNAINSKASSEVSDLIVAVFLNKVGAHESAIQKAVERLTSASKSLVAFPNAELALPSAQQLAQQLTSHFDPAQSMEPQVLGCDDAALDLSALDLKAPGPQVVVVCNSDAETSVSSLEGLQQALEATGRTFVAAVASAAKPANIPTEAVATSRRRALLASAFGPYTECDAACQTQVRWLEGILAALLLVLASMSGLCCLYFLDTPTRFETPKEAS